MTIKEITGKTRLFAVIGNPIEHSISPQLHNTISRELGLDFVYVPFRVEPNELENAVKGMRALNFAGFNVTIPYKNDIIALLDETDRDARLMGAVNTVSIVEGRLLGFNTDGEGFVHSFAQETGTGFTGKKVVLLGAGGAARALAVKIASNGAASLVIINRTPEKAEYIARLVNEHVNNVSQALAADFTQSRNAFREADIIINTIPIGMYPNVGECPIDDSYTFRPGQIAYDAIYNPNKTIFLKKAEQNGCHAVNGLGWLFYQGVLAYEIWTGIKLDNGLFKKIFYQFKSMFGNLEGY